MQQIPFIDLFKSALHVSGDKLAHPQKHFFWYNAPLLLSVGRNIGALYQNTKSCIYSQRVLLRMGEFVALNM